MREPVGEPDPLVSSRTQSRSGLTPASVSGSTTFSCAVSIGSRLKNWKMKPMCARRSSVSSLSPSFVMSCPAIVTLPSVGRSSPARMCISVDLPEPDGPMTAVRRPAATSRSTPRSALTQVSPEP